MENQEIQSEPNKEPIKKNTTGNEPERKEFGGGDKGSEIDTGQLHDNQEVDLDRTGPNEPGQGSEGKIHAGEGTSRGYESNTPDIDEETLKHGKRPSGGGDESRI